MFRNSFFSSIPPVCKNLIIINFLMWFATYIAQATFHFDLSSVLGLHYFEAQNFHFVQIFTYIFMHANFEHLFFNMFALLTFGSLIERAWGAKRFITFYIITGIGAGLVQIFVLYLQVSQLQASLPPEAIADVYKNGAQTLVQNLNYSDEILGKFNLLLNSETVGASGAIFGLLLAFGIMFPNLPMFIMFIPIPIKAKYLVIGYGLVEFFFGIANKSGDNVAHFAHLGGMLFGLLLILFWRKTTARRER